MDNVRPAITVATFAEPARQVRISGTKVEKKIKKGYRKQLNQSIEAKAAREGRAMLLSFKVKKPMGKKITRSRQLAARADGILDKRAYKRHVVTQGDPVSLVNPIWCKCPKCCTEFDAIPQKYKTFKYDKYGDKTVTCMCGTTYWHFNNTHIEKPYWRSCFGKDLILMSKISNWSK
jgi:hypothetical protein